MKSKIYVEVLREQISKSLELLTKHFSTDTSKVIYSLSESEQIYDKKEDGSTIPVYGIMIELDTVIEGKPLNKRLYYRRYEIGKSLNDIKAQAFKELFDVITGSFLLQAATTDRDTLEKLSKVRELK